MRRRLRFNPIKAFFMVVPLAIMLFWALAPIYWILVTAFTTNDKLYSPVLNLFPNPITLSHFDELFRESPFLRQLRNSFYVSTITTVVSAIVGCTAAYAITRLKFRGRQLIARFLIWSYLVPASVLFIPLFSLVQTLGLVGKTNSLLLAYLTFTVPFCTWLLIGYFKALPVELEEAAMVDGCSHVGALWRITLPLAAPALVVTTLFSFTLSWNEFLYAIVLVTNPVDQTVTAGIATFVGEDVYFWGKMFAGATLMSLPPVILYLVGQRWVIGGLTMGGIKA
jgi:multiple sugar transport system permease protein